MLLPLSSPHYWTAKIELRILMTHLKANVKANTHTRARAHTHTHTHARTHAKRDTLTERGRQKQKEREGRANRWTKRRLTNRHTRESRQSG